MLDIEVRVLIGWYSLASQSERVSTRCFYVKVAYLSYGEYSRLQKFISTNIRLHTIRLHYYSSPLLLAFITIRINYSSTIHILYIQYYSRADKLPFLAELFTFDKSTKIGTDVV